MTITDQTQLDWQQIMTSHDQHKYYNIQHYASYAAFLSPLYTVNVLISLHSPDTTMLLYSYYKTS